MTYKKRRIPSGDVLNFLFQEYGAEAQRGANKFIDAMALDRIEDFSEDVWERVQQNALDYLIYEYRFKNRKTGVENYLSDNVGDEVGATRIFSQIVGTQFFSEFEIMRVDRREYFVELEDIYRGEKYKVYDVGLSKSISDKGTILARIGKVDGLWAMLSPESEVMPFTRTERAKQIIQECTPKKARLDSVKKAMRFRIDLRTKREKEIENDINLDLTSAEARKMLRDAFPEIAEKYGVTLSWTQYTNKIRQETDCNPLDLLAEIFPDDGKRRSEKQMREMINYFMTSWNYLPHNSLNGKSPNEMAKEMDRR